MIGLLVEKNQPDLMQQLVETQQTLLQTQKRLFDVESKLSEAEERKKVAIQAVRSKFIHKMDDLNRKKNAIVNSRNSANASIERAIEWVKQYENDDVLEEFLYDILMDETPQKSVKAIREAILIYEADE